jgi:hypothetical protein
MITNERVAEIEAAITTLEATSPHWSNQMVYAIVGPPHHSTKDYLTQRRAALRVVPEAPEDLEENVPAPTLQEQLATAQAMRQAATRRVAALEALAQVQLLSESEELEQGILERRLRNLTPHIERLQAAVLREASRADTVALQDAWPHLMATTDACLVDVVNHIIVLKQKWLALLASHGAQEQAIERAGRAIAEALRFPDRNAYGTNLVNRMTPAMGWQMIFMAPDPIPIPRIEDLREVSPGSRPLPPRVLERALAERM